MNFYLETSCLCGNKNIKNNLCEPLCSLCESLCNKPIAKQ